MVTRASGLDKIAASFVDPPKEKPSGLKRAAAAAKATRKPRKAKVDERDPAVVAAQDAAGLACGFCHEKGHGFNDCPEHGHADWHMPMPDSGAREAPEAVSASAMSIPAVLTNGKALAARAFFSDDGWLVLPKDLPFDDYRELVVRFDNFHRNMLWVAGDLQAQGEALYGQDYSQVLEVLAQHGYTESTLGVAKSVAEKFPPGERHQALSFNHHMAVMALNKKERREWLDKAAAGEWPVSRLKAEISAVGGTPRQQSKAKAKARPLVETNGGQPYTGDTDLPDVVADNPSQQPVTVKGGLTLEMLEQADAEDREWYDALEVARKDMKETGACDHEALNSAGRAMASGLLELLATLGK